MIVVEGAFRVRPDTLIGQLADGGRLVGVDAIMGAPRPRFTSAAARR